MSEIKIKCKGNIGKYIHIKIGDKELLLNKSEGEITANVEKGTYEIIIICSNTEKLDKFSSLGLRIKPKIILPYKDKGFFNHLIGWGNERIFSVCTTKIKIKNDSTMILNFEKNYYYNFFETKEYYYKVNIISDNNIKILSSGKYYYFYNRTQKIKYTILQIVLVFLYYAILSVSSLYLFIDSVYAQLYLSPLERGRYNFFGIIGFLCLTILCPIRFLVYFFRLFKEITKGDDIYYR